MSARSYQGGSTTQQQHAQYSASSQYRNNDSRAGFGGSTPSPFDNGDQPQNIMHDKRVIRGSTYSLRRSIQSKLNDMDARSHGTKSTRRRVPKRRVKNRKEIQDLDRKSSTKTPRPVSGRLHAEIQTDPYLEEIYVTKKEQEFGTQTDPFLDRPSTPLFVPKLSGKSMATQIEDGDLFDFDREVEPILEVLIGKTIEQSLMEVLEEEELKSYTRYQSEFEQKRNVQLAQCQRLEEEQRRREQEKQRRVEQSEKQKQEELLLQQRVEAQRIATEFLENIEDAVLEELDKRGHFYDPIIKEIETMFIPKLMDNVTSKVEENRMSARIVDEMLSDAVNVMMAESMQIIQERDERLREEERVRIYLSKLEETYMVKRGEFTQAIKSQKDDYDFKAQIVSFLDIPLSVPPPEKKEEEDNENENEQEQEEEEEEKEIPPEIQSNIDFVETLMEQFGGDEEPLWKQIQSMMEKIGGETLDKISRIESYLQTFSVKESKKDLLQMFMIYKEDEDGMKKAISDCLGADSFNEEVHGKLVEALSGDEQKDQMEAVEEMVKEKANIKEFIATFTKQKADERLEAEEAAAKAQAEAEAAENEEDEE